MRRHFVGWLALAGLVVLPPVLAAQEAQQARGVVTAAQTQEPLAAVRVTVKGTTISAFTDAEGRFSIQAPAGATTLVFTYIGFSRHEAPIASEMDVALERQAIALEGVVVTSLGIEREARDLGYSVQRLGGEEVARVPEPNLVNTLQGRIAGVQITNSGPTGGSARIVIRGASSIVGNNQPLFVVDGIPVDNSSQGDHPSTRNQGFGGLDYGNVIQDLDPNNILDISVLKGPNAAALYGSRAQNGAVVITTKSGASGASVSISTMATAETPLRLPSYQNRYGQGVTPCASGFAPPPTPGDWGPTGCAGEFQWVDGGGGGTWDFVDESWGPPLDGRLIDQFTGPAQPWVPQPDNVRSFFETGLTWNTNLAVSQASDRAHVRLSVTNGLIEGMAPGNRIDRLDLALKGGAEISDRLTTEASLNYFNQDADNRPGTGYDEDNPMQSFGWFGRQVNMERLKDYRCDGNEPTPCVLGGQYNWNYNYHNNPYWEQLVNSNTDNRSRLIGHLEATYRLADWVTVTGRVGRDWYRERRQLNTEISSLEEPQGGFDQEDRYTSETNADLIVKATRQLTPEITLDVTAVGNVRENLREVSGLFAQSLTAPGIFSPSNAANRIPRGNIQRKEVRSLRGLVSVNYRNYLNVDLTASNDWSSTLPFGGNSYFYPSVSTAFVFSDALGIESRALSSGKVRASWTRVGNDTDPYQLVGVLDGQTAFGSAPMFSVPNQLANLDLRPEETQAFEVGADLGFLDERAGLVVTYYDRTTENQIMPVQISATSGFTSQILNAGKVRNYGFEVLLQANPVRLANGFRWDLTLNWAKNNSQVRELYGDLQTLVLGSYWGMNIEARGPRRDANGNIVEYYEYGTMFGNGYLRDAQGRLLLNAAGRPRVDPVRRVLGKYTPDWNGGIQNRFSYGPFELSVLVDGQMGGDIFTVTKWFGEYSGVLASTMRGRENEACDPGIVVPGVISLGPNAGQINGQGVTITTCPEAYWHGNFGNHERGLVSASYLKLRELRLGYRLPANFVSMLGFSGGDVALIGRNLLLLTENDNIDPETAFDASNVQGIEYGQFPTARSLGFSVTLRR